MWGLFILVFGLPWIVYPGVAQPYSEIKLILLIAIGWMLIFWKIFKAPSESTLGWRNPWTFWLIGWAMLTSLYKFQWILMQRPPYELNYIYNSYAWIDCMTLVMSALLAWSLATTYLAKDNNLHQLTQWICYGAVAMAVYGILQLFGFDQFFGAAGDSQRSVSIVQAGLGNASYLAIYLAMIFPLFFIFSGKRYLIFAAISLIAIYLTKVNYAFAIAGVGLAISFMSRWWLRMNRIIKIILGLSILIVCYKLASMGYEIFMQDERLEMWTAAITAMQSHITQHSDAVLHPSLTGYGLGSFKLLSEKFAFWDYAHNSWINIFVELGFVGVFLMAMMVIKSLILGWAKSTKSMIDSGWLGVFVAGLCASLVHFPERIPAIAFIWLVSWSITQRNTGDING